jgi:hypothetical protein
MIRIAAAVCLLASAAVARADSFLVFRDDRAAFEASLQVNPLSTVMDTGGAFAPNPAAATNLAAVTRTGAIGGQAYTWTGYDVNFSNTPTGTVNPGTVGGDIASATPVDAETPVAQGTATGAGSWGLDSGSGSTTSRNALLVTFTNSPGGLGIGHFALDLVDFEASAAFTRGTLRAYRGGSLVFTYDFDWGAADGNNQIHFLGLVAVGTDFFDTVAVVVGDDSSGAGNAETWAADRFVFGQAHAQELVAVTPEPGTFALFGVGAASIGAWTLRRARRKSR